ncbi:hypothetical protein AOL_s00215g419 [Orbilia oligospora ATCC 24927]|uniref:Uncharacterized protein n=2 Tax=Orbilia oligospora TaxID=2813651 RepID=G1XSS1_ARTOA|nr:hypothetical protein AOL_s00215g419 [Orbilia oligospora ATCC 24927]EGX43683.1 hypothetical protein AOL_s00215g419 [Orbilia oligospora ATCC 24927]KAF3273074.1 hypothetical protein TWF970_009365 [Orbilia oligospora]
MRFTRYFAIAAATLAFQTASLPILPTPDHEISVGQRDLTSISKVLNVMARNLASLPRLVSIPKVSALTELSPVEGTIEIESDPSPVSGSAFNKKSAISEPEPEELEEKLIRRATTMDPNVGISQDLPSGIVMFMIIFMLYAMFTAISMKDAD